MSTAAASGIPGTEQQVAEVAFAAPLELGMHAPDRVESGTPSRSTPRGSTGNHTPVRPASAIAAAGFAALTSPSSKRRDESANSRTRSITTIHVRPASANSQTGALGAGPAADPALILASSATACEELHLGVRPDAEEEQKEEHSSRDHSADVEAHASMQLLPLGQARRQQSFSVSRSGISSALRRVPLSAHRSFSALPDDVLSLSLEYLTSPELCSVARMCRRVERLSARNRLWAVRCGFMQSADVVAHVGIAWQLAQEQRFKQRFLLYRRWKIGHVEREYRRKVVDRRQRQVMCCMHCADGPFFLFATGTLLLLGFLLTARHVEQTRQLSSLDALAVWPYFAALAFVLSVVCCVCCARWDRHKRRWCHPRSYPSPADADAASPDGFVRAFLVALLRDDSGQIGLVAVMFLLVVLWAVLLLCRVCGWIHWSYPAVFAPLFATFALLAMMCFHPLAWQSRWKNRMLYCAGAWCFVVGPLCAFAILVCLRMESGVLTGGGSGQPLSWMFCVLPLLVLNLWFCLLGVALGLDERSVWPCVSLLCCWGPLLCFEVLLAYWLDAGGFLSDGAPLRFTHVLAPLWIFMSMCLAIGAVFSIFSRPDTVRLSVLFEPAPVREPLLL